MQAKQQQQQKLRHQKDPEPPASSEISTPQPKRARNEATGAAAGGSLGMSGEKTRPVKKESRAGAPAGTPKPGHAVKAETATEGAARKPAAAAAVEGGGSHFLAFAMAMSSAANYEGTAAVTEVAKALQEMTRKSSDAEACIRHALTVLAPASPAVPHVLSTAIAEAFGEPAIPGLGGEALAAKAFTDQQRKRSLRQSQPLTLEEVATTMSACCGGLDEASKATEQRLTDLLGRAQSEGMEVYFLVRALQGKVGPSHEVVYGAMARMLTAGA